MAQLINLNKFIKESGFNFEHDVFLLACADCSNEILEYTGHFFCPCEGNMMKRDIYIRKGKQLIGVKS